MITPVILTYNEECNIGSTLEALAWAPRVVLLDSGSNDRTEQIAHSFPNVSWFVREFDNHRSQWLHAIQKTSISTEYILALDADMRPGAKFPDELEQFLKARKFGGAWISFDYRVLGHSLRGSIYPAQIRIFRKDEVRIDQSGHTQVFRVSGSLSRFRSRLIHEDRKPLSRWLSNQMKYASLEADRIRTTPKTGLRDRVRLAGVSPAIWGLYGYLRAGGPFNNRVSRAYAYERLIFEALLSRMLADESFLPE